MNRGEVKTYPAFSVSPGTLFQVKMVGSGNPGDPDLYVRWGEVRAYLWTHKINGLTESDFYMAAKIDRVFEPA